MTFPIRCYRPERPCPDRFALLWVAPGLAAASVLAGHLIEAAWR